MANNVASFVLKLTREGAVEVKGMAQDLASLDALAQQLALSFAGAANRQRDFSSASREVVSLADESKKTFLGLNGAMGLVQTTLGVGFSVSSLLGIARAAAETVRSIGQIADIMGTTEQEASKLYLALENLGRNPEALRTAALVGDAAIQAARAGDARQRGAMLDLGINPDEVKNVTDLIYKAADAYRAQIAVGDRMLTQEEKITALRVLFGRSMRELLPLLEKGSDAMKKQEGITTEQRDAAERFLATINELQDAVKLQLGLPVAELINANKEIAVMALGVGGLLLVWQGFVQFGLLAKMDSFATAIRGVTTAQNAAALSAGQWTTAIVALALEVKIVIDQWQKLYGEMDKAQLAWSQEVIGIVSTEKSRVATLKELASYRDFQPKDTSKMDAQEATAYYKELAKAYHYAATASQYYADKDKTRAEHEKRNARDLKAALSQIKERPDFDLIRAGLNSQKPKDSLLEDPKDVQKKADEELRVLKGLHAAAQADRELAVARGDMTEEQALTARYEDVVADYDRELEAFDQMQAAITRKMNDPKVRKTDAAGKVVVVDQQAVDDLKKQSDELAAQRAQWESSLNKDLSDSSKKYLDITLRRQKEAADAQIALARAKGDELLAVKLEWQQKIDAAQRSGAGREEISDLEQTRDLSIAQTKFDQALKSASVTAGIYQDKLREINEQRSAGAISQQEATDATTKYKTSLQNLVDVTLPKLKALSAALKAAGKDTAALDKNIEDFQKASKTTTTLEEQARESQNFFDGMRTGFKMLERDQKSWGQVGVTVAQEFSTGMGNAATSAFNAWVTGSQSAGQAFKQMLGQMLLNIADAIIQVIVEGLIIQSFLLLLDAIFPGLGHWLAAMMGATAMAGSALSFGAAATGMAEGGLVSGGTPGRDSVPALLMPGEFVLPTHVVSQIGVDRLEAIRTGMAQRTLPLPSSPLAASAVNIPRISAAAASSRPVNFQPTLHVLVGDDEIARQLARPVARDAITVHVTSQPGKLKGSLDKHKGFQS
jgi:hypothetical protein